MNEFRRKIRSRMGKESDEELSECEKRICFGGHNKIEFLESLKPVLKTFKSIARDVLKRSDFTYSQVCVVGSVAEGKFGLRSLEKAVEYVTDLAFSTGIPVKEVEKIGNQSEDVCEFLSCLRCEFSDEQEFLKAARGRMCSDVDMVAFIEEPPENLSVSEENELFEDLLLEAVRPSEEELLGNMGIEPGVASVERKRPPTLCSPSDIDALIERLK